MSVERYMISRTLSGDWIMIDDNTGRSWSAADTAAEMEHETTSIEHIERHLMPVAPCCDCREQMDQYRHALAQIARYSGDLDYAVDVARKALSGCE